MTGGNFDSAIPSAVVCCPLWLKSTTTREIAGVVGNLHHAHAELLKHGDATEIILEQRAVLKVVDKAQPFRESRSPQIRGRAHAPADPRRP
jgi:hypothetical protein